jgi:NADH dehydrogenase (ubiquinone) 1 alpha subcomplex subunit 9
MQQRFNPVHVIDVGMALEQMLHDDTTASETYELFGPTNYSMEEIAQLVDREIVKVRRHINIPKRIWKPTAGLMNKYLWWPVGSADEVEREFIDQVIDPKAKTFKDLDIEPAELKTMTYEYLVSHWMEEYLLPSLVMNANHNSSLQKGYRSSAFYDLPPQTEREKREEKKYLHVLDDQ